jgi:3'-phosphoadenosine 5'-phosphosulfate sulfotransferase (PAPS reductase)/FAD synthetase
MRLPVIESPGRDDRPVALTPEIESLVAGNAPVAIGVSGGKDSSAVAFATVEYLNSVGHAGPRLLIHSDLGLTEWRASGPTCARLAERLGLELVTVRRAKGGMMERWEQRWRDNVARYVDLSCVQLILPWSTPDMRFCTSELKTAVICRELVQRFPGRRVVSVSGIRRQESARRAKAPVAKEQPKLASVTRRTTGIDWNAIIDWTKGDVLASLRARRFALHEAYATYDASRVSCVYCIMSTEDDLRAAARCPDNHAVGRRMVDLEIASSFAFQGDRWLGDVIADLLTPGQRSGLARAKNIAARRRAAESRIPKHLLYTAGWPTCIPTRGEAELLAEARTTVAGAVGLSVACTDADSIIARYEHLMAEKLRKAEKPRRRRAA